MPARLELPPKDKRDLFRRYARGETPLDLTRSRSDLKLTARQIANLISREGWAKQKAEIAEERKKSAQEALAQVREDGVRELEPILRDVAAGLKTDAAMLKDGWDLVEDAAGASSLMRAKNLHLARLMRFHGVDKEPASNARSQALAMVYVKMPNAHPPETAAVDVAMTESHGPIGGEDLMLEFADDESAD